MKSRFLTFTATRDGVVRHSFSEFPVSPKIEEAIRTDERSRLAKEARKARIARGDPVSKLFLASIKRLHEQGVAIKLESVLDKIFARAEIEPKILLTAAQELGIEYEPGMIDRRHKRVYFQLRGRDDSRSFKTIQNLITKFKKKSPLTRSRDFDCANGKS